MPKLIVSIDGVVLKEVSLNKAHTTIGRRPYNDIVIDHLVVSGEHGVFHLQDGGVEVEDLNSTNGTYVNGKIIQRQQLRSGDIVEMGKYRIRFLDDPGEGEFEKTMFVQPGAGAAPQRADAQAMAAAVATTRNAVVRVVSGAASGREMALVKVVTTIGKPGVAVASITKRHQGFVLAHVEGAQPPTLNGKDIDPFASVPLSDGDHIALADTQLQFLYT